MSGILGYIGQNPCNEFIFKSAKKLSTADCESIGIGIKCDNEINHYTAKSIDHLKEHIASKLDINTAIIETNNIEYYSNLNSPATNDEFCVCSNAGMTNIDNINLPFNMFKRPQNMDYTALYLLEYLKNNHKGEIIKSNEIDALGDLTFAFFSSTDDAIYCKMGATPIFIGLANSFNIIASDINAIRDLTSKVIYLQSGEKAKITRDKVTIYNSKNHKIKKPISKIENRQNEYVNLALCQQLFTLPTSINQNLSSLLKDNKLCFNKTKITKLNAKAITNIILLSTDASYYACKSAKYIFDVLCNIPTEVYNSKEYVRSTKIIDDTTLVIAISDLDCDFSLTQSVIFAKQCGAKVIGITSKDYSYLERLCSHTINIKSNTVSNLSYGIKLEEFCNSYLALSLFALYLAKMLNTISPIYTDVAIKMAQNLTSKITQSVKPSPLMSKYSKLLINSKNLIVTGCGIDYPVCVSFSNSLSKVINTSVNSTYLFDLESTAINCDTTILAVITNKDYLNEYKNILKRAVTKGANVIIVTNVNIESEFLSFKNVLSFSDSLPIFNILPVNAGLYSIIVECENLKEIKNKSVAI